MPSPVVIRIDNISKKYTIRHQTEGAGLRHVIQNAALRPARMITDTLKRYRDTGNGKSEGGSSRPSHEEFWALRDVSLDIRQGEVVGIIGRNGAGKSTLLKILSRITEPTRGRVGIKGRIASLLEVGTGFHPELTGRENVFLNGAILGMTRREISGHFDEIVDFAGIDKFIDTPVKRYSSGMYLRLAFAVAAHLNPEILLIDEILAVGDSEFQKKCLGKIQDVASGLGRTVFFVSHQLESVLSLCTRVCLLKAGRLVADGKPDAIVRQYQARDTGESSSAVDSNPDSRPGRGSVRITNFEAESASFDPAGAKRFRLKLETRDQREAPFYLALLFFDEQQRQVLFLDSHHSKEALIPGGLVELNVVLESPWLCPGEYRIDAYLYNPDIIDKWEDACRFTVSSQIPYEGSVYEHAIRGSIVLPAFAISQRAVSSSLES
jgi:lipopolysaccharide transport system ATP-binding protein